MVLVIIARKANVGTCGTCMDARGLDELELVAGVYRSSMEELTDLIVQSDKIISY